MRASACHGSSRLKNSDFKRAELWSHLLLYPCDAELTGGEIQAPVQELQLDL